MTGKDKFSAAVLTVSTSCARGEREDESGPLLVEGCRKLGLEVAETAVVPDDAEAIRERLLYYCDKLRADLVLTTGGTGPGPFDITPEETGLEVATINHISEPIYSSAGLTDESCCMVMVEARGTISNEWQEEGEDIEVLLLDVNGIRELLESGKKISAKAWGLLYHYAETGSIR